VTLPILRQVAPRAFVNHLWQAALHGGHASRLVCPACDQPFTEFAEPQAQIKTCVRCFWVWFSADGARRLLDGAMDREPARSSIDARRVLGSLAAGELATALPRAPTPRRRRPIPG
jgi:hypothetical protein